MKSARLILQAALLCAAALTMAAATFYQVNNGVTTTITEHSVCREVTNNFAGGNAIFVPTNTSTEWSAFYNNTPPGVAAYPCVTTGAAYCWGYNNSGQSGKGSTSPGNVTSPSLVVGGWTDWSTIDAGGWFSCGLRNSTAYCWGEGLNGKLGYTGTANRTSPSIVAGGWSDWVDISAGTEHTCGIRNGGVAYCWGDTSTGEVGNGLTTPDRTSPTLVLGGWTDWSMIRAGENFSCGIRAGGMLYCWGDSANGKLGNGTITPDRTSPSLVLGGFTDWISVHPGRETVCGLRSTGQAYCWGDGATSQIGDGGAVDRTSPSIVAGGFNDWTSIATYFDQSCGIRNGAMYCWGSDARGQLGNDAVTGTKVSPSLVDGGFTDWTDSAAGGYYGCGIHGGSAKCWGYNTNGWLGDGTTTTQASPSSVLGFGDWISIDGAGSHTCGIEAGCSWPSSFTPGQAIADIGSIASSDDGQKLVAAAPGGQLYTSIDSGVTWTPREASRTWTAVASSSDGGKLYAIEGVLNGQVYTSADSGVTWSVQGSPLYLRGLASSSDGTKLIVSVYGGQLYTSTDSGVTWTPRYATRNWGAVTSAGNGVKLAALYPSGQIYTSADSGVTWAPRDASRTWSGITSSLDGTKLLASVNGGQLYTSVDSGLTWTARETSRNWRAVVSSSDGKRLAAAVSGGQIFTSADYGITWIARESNRTWGGLAYSANGKKLVAADTGFEQIYTAVCQ